jgi:hypothetical protein
MKPFFWLLSFGILVYMLQYGLFKENGEPRGLPVMAAGK